MNKASMSITMSKSMPRRFVEMMSWLMMWAACLWLDCALKQSWRRWFFMRLLNG
jgi:hypothetical protein